MTAYVILSQPASQPWHKSIYFCCAKFHSKHTGRAASAEILRAQCVFFSWVNKKSHPKRMR